MLPSKHIVGSGNKYTLCTAQARNRLFAVKSTLKEERKEVSIIDKFAKVKSIGGAKSPSESHFLMAVIKNLKLSKLMHVELLSVD